MFHRVQVLFDHAESREALYVVRQEGGGLVKGSVVLMQLARKHAVPGVDDEPNVVLASYHTRLAHLVNEGAEGTGQVVVFEAQLHVANAPDQSGLFIQQACQCRLPLGSLVALADLL